MPDNNEKPSNIQEFLNGLSLAMTGRLAQVTLSHPFEGIKLQKQYLSKTQPNHPLPTGWALAKDILTQPNGIRRIYRGFPTNATKLVGKEVYKYPCLVWIPEHLKQYLPEGFAAAHPVLTTALPPTLSLTAADTLISTPLDQIINTQITHHKKTGESLSPYQIASRMAAKGELGDLYRGWKANLANRGGLWASFMLTDAAVKELFKAHDIEAKPGSATLLAANTASGIFLAASTTPLDVIKHQITGVDPLPTKNPWKAAQIICAEQGKRAFLVGAPQKMVQSVLLTILYSNLMALRAEEKGNSR